MKPRIIVVGSINMDIVNRVKRYPEAGETIHGLGTEYSPGGKGANQAVAASLAGGEVQMIGAVGNDPFGAELTASLQRYGVDTSRVMTKEGTSGLAFITVTDEGENSIILSAGANGQVSVDDLDRLFEAGEGDTILLQNEIPWASTRQTMRMASARGATVILNPAPAIAEASQVLSWADVIVLNETEAEAISGVTVTDVVAAGHAADGLIAGGAKAVLLTLGEHGSLYVDAQGERIRTPAFKVKAVDTTAAGDTFIGAFAASGGTGLPLAERLRFAAAAAALAVTRQGAQASIPRQAEIEAFLASGREGSGREG
jgi:ribokinase